MRRPALLLACVAALLAAGCDRRPTLIPASADSTAVAPDSFSVQARRAADAWEAGDDGAAASASALLAREALDSRPDTRRGPSACAACDLARRRGLGRQQGHRGGACVRPTATRHPVLAPAGRRPLAGARDARLHLSSVATLGMGDDSEPNDSAQVAVLWIAAWRRRAAAARGLGACRRRALGPAPDARARLAGRHRQRRIRGAGRRAPS